jgi:hypothetical protein
MKSSNKSNTALWIALALAVMLVVYTLSFGPVCWLSANYLPPVAVSILLVPYTPLMAVAETNESMHELLQWYVHLWAENVEI